MLRRCLATPHPAFGMIPQVRVQAGSHGPAPMRNAVPTPTAAAALSQPGQRTQPQPQMQIRAAAPPAHEPPAEYGTMLEIRNVQMLPDGRSIVETWGSWRFRIMERGVLDGYTVARVERVEDFGAEVGDEEGQGEGQEPSQGHAEEQYEGSGVRGEGLALGERGERRRVPSNAELMAQCCEFLEELKEGTPWVGQRLNAEYVPMPSDAERFSFWMALVRLFFVFVHHHISCLSCRGTTVTDTWWRHAAPPDTRPRKSKAPAHPLAPPAPASRRTLDRAAPQQLVSSLSLPSSQHTPRFPAMSSHALARRLPSHAVLAPEGPALTPLPPARRWFSGGCSLS
jgi:hypothetical protein